MAILKSDNMSLNAIIQRSIRDNWNLMAVSDLGGVGYQYRGMAEMIEKLHILFEEGGIKRGDRVAICGRNSSNWTIVFMACITAGVVAVPILHEFKAETVQNLVNHSEAKLLFVDASIWENLDERAMPKLLASVFLVEFGMPYCRDKKFCEVRSSLNELFGRRYPSNFSPSDVVYPDENPEDLAIINYTSGSTGKPKGVMLPYRSILGNVKFSIEHLDFFGTGDGMVNMLPLAHLYGMVIEMLHPLCKGCHCHFLTRLPSPKVILQAFADIKPKLIITVPLILEKIIRSRVFPLLEKPLMKLMLKVPLLDDKLLAKVKAGLEQAFGGELRELIIGGAPLNSDVERFLLRIGFPFTVGYGMTECGPLIAYAAPGENPPGACGKIVDGMEMRVNSPDPVNIPGDLWVKGVNVMQGYLKNPEATKEVMPDDDGWMNTGDMCTISPDGYLKICGRSKTMILGPSGQNIYPEEIEQKLNMLPFVAESLIVDDGGKLVALIYPDYDSAEKEGLTEQEIDRQMAQNIETLNKEVPAYSKVARYKIFLEEFEKTPKRSIKRFLYQP